MNALDPHLLPEAKTAPMFAALAVIVCILWMFTIGFWSVIPFALGFSFVKRRVTLTGKRNAEIYVSDIDQLRVELRHLNSKLLVGGEERLRYGRLQIGYTAQICGLCDR